MTQTTHEVPQVQLRRFDLPLALEWVREHGVPLLLYTLLSLAASWPTILHFNTRIASSGGDARHNLWIFWHTKEFFKGNQPLFSTELLFYPQGASLLTHGLGPITGVFSLPFWPWGPEAAHNGALLVSLMLTGYFMYLLGRGLGFGRPVSLFAGLVLLMAPMHLGGIFGHMTKAFLGMLPLVLLALLHTLDRKRSPWWAVGTALALLGTLLHSGYQFVFAALSVAFFAAVAFWRTEWEERFHLLRRLALLGIACLIIVGPLLFATVRASEEVKFAVQRNQEAFHNQPDVIEFVLPSRQSLLFGDAVNVFLHGFDVRPTIETTVSLSITGMLLCLVALLRGPRQARWWLLFLAFCVILSAGPALKILGDTIFTDYDLPVILPYAFVTELPGLSFMRAPGRFMMIGYVALAAATAYGLHWLVQSRPRLTPVLVIAASALLLVETWPRTWPMEQLASVPQFYLDIADDPEMYGVFDIPIIPKEDAWYPGYASYRQMYQMTHGKGITAGYLSRVYEVHPLFPCLFPEFVEPQPDIFVNGEPYPCYMNTLYELSFHNYRYVVRHKAQEAYPNLGPNSWGDLQAQLFVDRFFADQEPLVDDELVTVYEVPEQVAPTQSPVLMLAENWYSYEGEWRWARSPASLRISSPQAQRVSLELMPHTIFAPSPERPVGYEGVLIPSLNGETLPPVTIRLGELASIPLDLPAGVHTVTLTLEAGNFRPGDYGGGDWRWLSFATRFLNLSTAGNP